MKFKQQINIFINKKYVQVYIPDFHFSFYKHFFMELALSETIARNDKIKIFRNLINSQKDKLDKVTCKDDKL